MSERITEAELAEIEQDWQQDSVHRRTKGVPQLLAEVRRLRGLIGDLATIPPGHDVFRKWLTVVRAEADAIRSDARGLDERV
jgi:hypothetical protein